MPNVLIRDLSEDVHAHLRERAAAAGQSLQQFLVAELTRLANTPTLEEVLRRIESRTGGGIGFQAAIEDLEDERAARDRR